MCPVGHHGDTVPALPVGAGSDGLHRGDVSRPWGSPSPTSRALPATAGVRPSPASVVRSPGIPPPTVRMTGATPSRYNCAAKSRRLVRTGEALPQYWDAPRDHDRVRAGDVVLPRLGHDPARSQAKISTAAATRTSTNRSSGERPLARRRARAWPGARGQRWSTASGHCSRRKRTYPYRWGVLPGSDLSRRAGHSSSRTFSARSSSSWVLNA